MCKQKENLPSYQPAWNRVVGRHSCFTAKFYSLLFYILDGVGQRLILGLRKKKDNKATEDGKDPIDDPWYVVKVCLEDHKQRRQG